MTKLITNIQCIPIPHTKGWWAITFSVQRLEKYWAIEGEPAAQKIVSILNSEEENWTEKDQQQLENDFYDVEIFPETSPNLLDQLKEKVSPTLAYCRNFMAERRKVK